VQRSWVLQHISFDVCRASKPFIGFVACTILDKNKKKKRKITSATGAENRTMSQFIFNPNRCKK